MKTDAFYRPLKQIANEFSVDCGKDCPLNKKCTKNITFEMVISMRESYFGIDGDGAPNDIQRKANFLNLLRTKSYKTENGKLIFTIDERKVKIVVFKYSYLKMCTAGFLRILGVINSAELSKAPGQIKRLMDGYLEGKSEEELLSKQNLKLDENQFFTALRGQAKAYILEVAEYFADAIPSLQSENTSTHIRVVPYKSVSDMFTEFEFHCDAANPPILENDRASYSTFLRAWNELHEEELVRLLGGKGGFQTCSICNNCLQIKKSSYCKKDLITVDVVRKISRMHLLQQQNERQHAENFIHACKSQYVGNQPVQAFVELDGQTVVTGNTPKLAKERNNTPNAVIENRNIGGRVVCGPIDKWISISTNNLIPGGANVMIEATKMAIEILAEMLAEHDIQMPRRLGVQYDNCGENKV